MVTRNEENAQAYLKMWDDTLTNGVVISPRGLPIREIADLQITLDPRYPFQSFEDRKYNVGYFKDEMRWKLSANPYDDTIKKSAKMWESVQNPDGTFNSNYGQYWFGPQKGMWSVVEELVRDKDSRRAVIPMLSKEHMTPQTKDTVCTESVGFRIRNDVLHMSVHMRSSDQVFGLGTDVPTFSMLMMFVHELLVLSYPDLELGKLTITAMSSHIYDRHFTMLTNVVNKGLQGYTMEEFPRPFDAAEVMAIVAARGKVPASKVYDWHRLTKWLFDIA